MASATPRKFPSANWSVPLTLSAMDLGMSSGWAACLVAEFCGVPDFPTAERASPHMTRRAATRKMLILASVSRKRIREPRSEVECAGTEGEQSGTLRPPSCEEGHSSLHNHPSDCDGLHRFDSPDSVWRSCLQHRS